MNTVTLFGNVGGDPELRAVGQSGAQVAKFSLATTERWNDKDGNKQEKTSWHTVEAWGKQAEVIAKHVKKGAKLLVEGAINYEEYEKDGQKKFFTKIKLRNFEFGGGPKPTGEGGEAAPAAKEDPLTIPF